MKSIVNVLILSGILCKHHFHSAWNRIRSWSVWLFLTELIKHPGTIGAVLPSSRPLASAMARQVPVSGKGLIVEVGAGTGSVTQALLDAGISPDRLLVVERSPTFVRHLQDRYPTIRIVQGDATQLHTIVPKNAVVDAIVSSLPLRSLTPIEVSVVVEQWHKVLKPDGVVVQFTYSLHSLIKECLVGFKEQAKCLVWINIPPARVCRLSRQSQA